jgi:hypothetical protein
VGVPAASEGVPVTVDPEDEVWVSKEVVSCPVIEFVCDPAEMA